MRLIIKGPLKCSGACAFAWVSSGKSFAFHLDVYGFMHGTTYCLIGHHGNDIVAVGSARLRVNGWIWAWVCSIRGKTIKKWFTKVEAGVHPQVNQSNTSAQWCQSKNCRLFFWSDFCPFTEIHIHNSTLVRSWGWVGDHCLSPLIDWLLGIKFQTINTIKNPLKPLKPQRNGNHLTIKIHREEKNSPSMSGFQLPFQ